MSMPGGAPERAAGRAFFQFGNPRTEKERAFSLFWLTFCSLALQFVIKAHDCWLSILRCPACLASGQSYDRNDRSAAGSLSPVVEPCTTPTLRTSRSPGKAGRTTEDFP